VLVFLLCFFIFLSPALGLDSLTNQLLASPDSPNAVNLARQRRQLFLSKIETDPNYILDNLIPHSDFQKIPPSLYSYLESEITLSGQISLIAYDDFQNQKSGLVYQLKTDDKKTYQLYFVTPPRSLTTGSDVWLHGVALDDKVVLQSDNSGIRFPLRVERLAAVPPNVGEQKTIVLLIKVNGQAGWGNVNRQEVSQIISGRSDSVDSFYRENSYYSANPPRGVYFTPTVSDWLTVDPPANPDDTCIFYRWAKNSVNPLAARQGINLDNYSKIVYLFDLRQCNGAWAYLNAPDSYISSAHLPGATVFIHEIGHNFGAAHANTYDCYPKSIDRPASCRSAEYGELYDVMGWSSGGRHFNAPHKKEVGWIPDSRTTYVTFPGTYTVFASEQYTSEPQIIIVTKSPSVPSYYVGYRKAFGFDADLPSSLFRGVQIHTRIKNSFGYEELQTQLLDTNPEPRYGDWNSKNFEDHTLSDGQTFTDDLNGISIKQISHNADSATVEVSFATCPGLCPSGRSRLRGDANCDGIVDMIDFSVWLREYIAFINLPITAPQPTWTADFDCDQAITMIDFSLWLSEYQSSR